MKLATLRLRTRLLSALVGIMAFTLLATGVALYSLGQVGTAVEKVSGQHVPAAVASLKLSRQAERIANKAPELLNVSTEKELRALSEGIAQQAEHLNQLLPELQGQGLHPPVLIRIEETVGQLLSNLVEIERLSADRLRIDQAISDAWVSVQKTLDKVQKLLDPGLRALNDTIDCEMSNQGDPDQDPAVGGVTVADLLTELEPYERVQDEVSKIYKSVLDARTSPDAALVKILQLQARSSMRKLDKYLFPGLREFVKPELVTMREIIEGPKNLFDTRGQMLSKVEQTRRLLKENVQLSAKLTTAVDELTGTTTQDIADASAQVESVQKFGTFTLLAVGSVSLLISVLIVYVIDRGLIARITTLTKAARSIVDGDLETEIPGGGNDEIGDLSTALSQWLRTEREIRETSLRDIQEARQQLAHALDTNPAGFSLFNEREELVLCNRRYRDAYPGMKELFEPGARVQFETIIREAVKLGLIPAANSDPEQWIEERLSRFRAPGDPVITRRRDGRWLLITERRIEGETVALYIDITQEHERARRLALLEEIARTANEDSLENALESALQQICTHIDWPIGHVYRWSEASTDELLPTTHWYVADPVKFKDFREATQHTSFTREQGLPGQVVNIRRAKWIPDVTKEPTFRRAHAARKSNLKSAFAFPVFVGGDVRAVFEFFCDKVIERDEALLETMAQVGTQLGRAVERAETQAALTGEKDRAERSFQERSRFMANVSHQLRNPLDPIINLIKLVRRQNVNVLPEKHQVNLEKVLQGGGAPTGPERRYTRACRSGHKRGRCGAQRARS